MLRGIVCLLIGVVAGIGALTIYGVLAYGALCVLSHVYPPIGDFGMPPDAVVFGFFLALSGAHGLDGRTSGRHFRC